MWLLFHRKSGTKVVAGGKTFTDECPTCEHTTRFKEVEVGESYGVWFVDVVSDAERAFRCESCGDVFDLRVTRPDTLAGFAGTRGAAVDFGATAVVVGFLVERSSSGRRIHQNKIAAPTARTPRTRAIRFTANGPCVS